jgi:nucleoside-triphosphatase THEP1
MRTKSDSKVNHSNSEFSGSDPFAAPQINTFFDWLTFVNQEPLTRPLSSLEEYTRLSEDEKQLSQAERKNYIAAFQPIMTDSQKDIVSSVLRLAQTNRRSSSRAARPGTVLTGLPTVGKTTLVLEIGRRYDALSRKLLGNRFGTTDFVPGTNWRFVPVIFIALGNDETWSLKALYSLFAQFLMIENYEQKTAVQLKHAIIKRARECETTMVIIDEISNLNVKVETDAQKRGVIQANTALKSLMNSIPATFIYAGINCDSTGIFQDFSLKASDYVEGAEENSTAQTNRRFSLYKIYPYATRYKNHAEGKKLIASMDQHITLLKHQPGDLGNLSTYIMERTNGFIGAIRSLIAQGGEVAIKDQHERLTKKLLDKIKLDNASETQYAARKPSRATSSKVSTSNTDVP